MFYYYYNFTLFTVISVFLCLQLIFILCFCETPNLIKKWMILNVMHI